MGEKKKTRKFSTWKTFRKLPLTFNIVLVLFFPPPVLNSGAGMHGITQRSNVQEGSISNSRTSPPILAPKLLALRRARSWNNLVRRVSPTRIQLLPLVRSSEFIAAENRP